MKLVAIYIPKNSIPYIFGDNHLGHTLNLGGQYIYEFEEKEVGIIHLNEKKINDNFILNFFGEKISLISTIVGDNGSGKTTILQLLNDMESHNKKSRNILFIYENINDYRETFFINETSLQIDFGTFKINDIATDNRDEIPKTLYYSPNLDFELRKIKSPISLVDYFDKGLEEYFLDAVRRHLFFLSEKDLILKLKSDYPDFPYYDKIYVEAKSLYKDDFEKAYIQTTLGNKLFKVRNLLYDYVKYNKEVILTDKLIEEVFEKNQSIQDELKALWELYPNSDEKNSQLLHNSNNFINNVEVNILSYLILDDTFTLNGDNNGSYHLNHFLEAMAFEDKLTEILRKFIANKSKFHFEILGAENITVSNIVKINYELNSRETFQNGTLPGKVDIGKLTKIILKDLNKIDAIHKFYQTLIRYIKQFNNGNDKIVLNIENGDLEAFNTLIEEYKNVLTHLPKLTKYVQILEFTPNKKLSTGEKAILDLHASIYHFITKYSKSHYQNKNYLLLLDEPDLGYHPKWKKKFVNAILKTLPILFSYYEKFESLQLIFTTHEPLTLSDIPNDKIIYLEKTQKGDKYITQVLSKEKDPMKKSFGANITDLLSDSFFIDDGLIGDFSKEKIESTISWIRNEKNKKDKQKEKYFIDEKQYDSHKKLISIIDEHIIRIKLAEMLEELKGESIIQKELIDREIEYLKFKKNNL